MPEIWSELLGRSTNGLFSVWRGMAGSDADRLYRSVHEISPRNIGKEKDWILLQKGGPYSPFYYFPEYLLLHDKGSFSTVLHYGSGRITNSEKYYKPGISFGKRTDRIYGYLMHANEVFSVEGQAVFPETGASIWQCLAVINSAPFQESLNAICGQHKLHGYVNEVHFPYINIPDCSDLARNIWENYSKIDTANELSHVFIRPLFASIRSEDNNEGLELERIDERISIIGQCKKLHKMINRKIISSVNAPAELENLGVNHQIVPNLFGYKGDAFDETFSLISWVIGCIFGRWNILLATEVKEISKLPDPFAPLLTCSPGMLQNTKGLPAESKDVPADYPLRISWSGIIVNDEGHPEDIITRVREAIGIIWKDKANDIEQEVCEILGVRTLREYLSKPSKFFAGHSKRYSKSRRQAPIYWPLSTSSGSYALWLYYHRLTDQTLYICVNNFVGPKLKQALDDTENLRKKSSRTSQEEKDLEKLSDLATELKDFHDELLRIAKFWKPNLNDGVQITAAPLWKLFQHKPWQKKLKQTWKDLEKGKYDWAHLAYSIWPERVIRDSHKNRSYAIAHDLEDDLWEEIEKRQRPPGKSQNQMGAEKIV